MLYCGRGQVKANAEEAISEAISEAKVNAVVEESEVSEAKATNHYMKPT